MPATAPRKPSYAKSFAHRIGAKMMRRRNPLKPSDLTELDLTTLITGSAEAARTLHDSFGSMKALARFGGEKGFAPLAGYPGVTPNVIAKLEAWLEGIGRVTE